VPSTTPATKASSGTTEQLPASHHAAFAALRRDCEEAARLHAVERCRRFASAPRAPSPQQAGSISRPPPRHRAGPARTRACDRRRRFRRSPHDEPRRVLRSARFPDFLRSAADLEGRVLEATLLAAGPVGAGINLEYYFSTVNNEGYGCGSKVMHNLAGLFGVMQGASSDLRTGLPLQMVEIHEPMRLLVVVEQTRRSSAPIYQRQPPLQELIGNGWIVLAAKHPQTGAIHLFAPATGWQPGGRRPAERKPMPALAEVERSLDWFAGRREALPPALLRRPVTA
jgi:hypothetical protein